MIREVRAWREGDRAAAIEVVRSVFDEYSFTWDEDTYHADLYDVPLHYHLAGDLFVVATLDGEVKGTGGMRRFASLPGAIGDTVEVNGKTRAAGTDCSLERLYVHPEYRRRGLGKALLERIVQEAVQQQREAMEVWSDKRFEDAHRLYMSFGAQIVGERVCDDPDESPEWGLVLPL